MSRRPALRRVELAAAIDAARRAGAFIKNKLGRVRTVEHKGAIDLVTDVDRRAEDIIVRQLRRQFPDYGILAEERPPISAAAGRWIIDPLDGTTNFSRQFPFFAVSIALECAGMVELGVVYDPLREELFFAQQGSSAYLNNKKLRVSSIAKMDQAFLATGFPYAVRERPEKVLAAFNRIVLQSLAVRRAGAASLDLCYVACGRFDGFWEQELKPWDTAAAGLIVRAAGGRLSDFRGGSWDCHCPATVASNGSIHNQLVRVLAEVDMQVNTDGLGKDR